jgi:hypothetical protein
MLSIKSESAYQLRKFGTGGVDSSPTCRPREIEGAIPAGQRRAPGGKREASATMSELRKGSSVEIEYRCVLPSK